MGLRDVADDYALGGRSGAKTRVPLPLCPTIGRMIRLTAFVDVTAGEGANSMLDAVSP